MIVTETEQTPSLVERVKPVTVDGSVVAAHFLGTTAAFVLSEEVIVLARAGDTPPQHVPAHAGGILASAAAGERIITGGDDGRVVATDAEGRCTELARDAKGRWIDRVALGPGGTVAWAAGKTVAVEGDGRAQRTLDVRSSVGGLAFAPKGVRLAIAHYNGATLWFPNVKGEPEFLEWKGSHLGISFSPDGRFLVTTMQEPMLHGWRLADAKHMRMSGYSTKVRSLAWTAGGEGLATSGSEQLIVWPFQGKDGPMGKSPQMLAPHEEPVVAVACHPREAIAAVGYANGMLLLVRLSDGSEILVRRPSADPIAAVAWSASGDRLAFGTEGGTAGVLKL
jgi:WD40 repeat protein